VREIDDSKRPENDRQTHGDDHEERAKRQPVEDLSKE
jgi:hypothetical protein